MTASSSTTCAYLGPEGTYTEEAAFIVAPTAERKPLPTIEAVFQAVADGQVSLGVVPIENLIQGPVTEVLDCLYEHAHRVRLAGMRVLPIRHGLGVKDPAARIEAIYSKDQALKQCSRYLQEHHPTAALVETASTTAPMREIADGRLHNAAVVGHADALARHGLSVIAEDIGNSQANKTKFAILRPRALAVSRATGADTTLCVVYPHRDRVGLLRTVVDVVSARCGLNLSAIHSRPDAQGSFRFYLEIEGHESDPTLIACFDMLRAELSEEHVDVAVVGSYPRTTFIEHRISRVAVLADAAGHGTWLSAFLPHGGYEVVQGAPVAGADASWKDCDVVVLSGSATDMTARVRAVSGRLRSGQLLVLDCDCQGGPLRAALETASAEVEVLGMNVLPAYGGHAAENRGVVFVHTGRSHALAGEFEAMFYKQGARLTYSSPEHHDRQMAYHRHLTYLTQVALAETGERLFGERSQLERMASPASRTLLSGLTELLDDSGILALRALTENAEAPAVLRAFLDSLETLGRALADGDAEPLTVAATRARDAFLAPATPADVALDDDTSS